jgi:uncharacterized protein
LTSEALAQGMLPHLVMPAITTCDRATCFSRRLHGTLAAAAERGPVDFPELLLTPGVGARMTESVNLIKDRCERAKPGSQEDRSS